MRIFLAAMLIIALPGVSVAQGDRSETWDVSLSAIFQDSKKLGGEGGSTLDIDSDVGFGINFAYNWTNKLALGMDIEFLRPKYQATLVDETGVDPDLVVRHELSQVNTRFKATFNLLEGPFTPYLEAGLGWSFFDSNVADGPPITGCWWHPIWGYICSNYYSTYDDTLFSYGAGVGLRYETNFGGFVKASYNYWEMDKLGRSGDPAFESVRIEFGRRF